MSIALLNESSAGDHSSFVCPVDSCPVSADPPAAQPIRIGQYSVTDTQFIRRAAMDMMQRCLLRGRDIPAHIVAVLRLEQHDRHAMGMEEALHHMADLRERRAAICLMIHAIVSLQ